jgi:hypothetical protein
MNQIFDPEIYKDLPYDDLLMFALYSVIQSGAESSIGKLVVECFKLFPQRFGLSGYMDKYPDSAQVEKSWLRCRTDKGLIVGNKAHGFQITSRGLDIVSKTQKRLGSKVFDNQKILAIKGDRKTKTGRLVKQLEENNVFKEYKKIGDKVAISEYELGDLIYSTMDALPENRRKNLQQLKDAVTDYNRDDMLAFLGMCESRFGYLFFSESERNKEYAGGMNKRRVGKK